MTALHKNQTLGGVHTPIQWEYENATIREAATGFVAIDKFKFAVQTDNNSIWILIDTDNVVWAKVNSESSQAGDTDVVFISARKATAGSIPKGSPVYVAGYNAGGWVLVELARANSLATMPVIGLAQEIILDSATSKATLTGPVIGLDTSSFEVRDTVYVSESIVGELKNTRPIDSLAFIQAVGTVLVKDAVQGVIQVTGNAFPASLPNASPGAIWIGGDDYLPTERAFVHGNEHINGTDDIPEATTESKGLMSLADKLKLNTIAGGDVVIPLRNETGAEIPEGKLVYVYDYNNSEKRPLAAIGDKDDSAKRPVVAITIEAVPNDTNFDGLVVGTLIGKDTSALAITDQLVLGSDGNLSRPPEVGGTFTGEIQNVGSITRVHPSDGRIVISIDGMSMITGEQFFALVGTEGTPSNANKYVTDLDPRMTDSRDPSAHEHEASEITNFNEAVQGDPVVLANATRVSLEKEVAKTFTGFKEPENVVVFYDSVARTITLSGTVKAVYLGVEIPELVNGWVSEPHPENPTQNLYLKHDGTNFSWSTTLWAFDELQIAIVQFASNGALLLGMRETHGTMPWEDHEIIHEVVGTRRKSGGDVTDLIAESTTIEDRRPMVSACVLSDEDLPTTNAAHTTKNDYTFLYLTGSAGTPVLTRGASDVLAKLGDVPYWNEFNGSVWQSTLLGNRDYMCVWLLGLQTTADSFSQQARFIWMAGQSQGTLTSQRNLIPADLSLGEFASPEYVFLEKLIYRYQNGNWHWVEKERITGSKAASVQSPAGNYLSIAAVDGVSIQGDATPSNPLVANPVEIVETVVDTFVALTTISYNVQLATGVAIGAGYILPDATTLLLGRTFEIKNASNAFIVVKNNDSTFFEFLAPGCAMTATVSSITTQPGVWEHQVKTPNSLPSQVTINCIGDEITAGAVGETPYTDFLDDITGQTSINRGVSGSTALSIINGQFLNANGYSVWDFKKSYFPWYSVNAAVLSLTGIRFKIAHGGTVNPRAELAMVEAGVEYRIHGDMNGDGTSHPTLNDAGGGVLWTGTTDTTKSSFDETFTAVGDSLYVECVGGTTGNFVEARGITIERTDKTGVSEKDIIFLGGREDIEAAVDADDTKEAIEFFWNNCLAANKRPVTVLLTPWTTTSIPNKELLFALNEWITANAPGPVVNTEDLGDYDYDIFPVSLTTDGENFTSTGNGLLADLIFVQIYAISE